MTANHRATLRLLLLCSMTLAFLIVPAYGHVQVSPKESIAGADERYTMRVPTEKALPTVRIEAEFPTSVAVSDLESKPGWKIERKMDGSGKITGATWTGSSIAPHEVAEFVFHAHNPNQDTKLVWKVIQIYQDGSKSEWTGPEGSRAPAPVTTIKKK